MCESPPIHLASSSLPQLSESLPPSRSSDQKFRCDPRSHHFFGPHITCQTWVSDQTDFLARGFIVNILILFTSLLPLYMDYHLFSLSSWFSHLHWSSSDCFKWNSHSTTFNGIHYCWDRNLKSLTFQQRLCRFWAPLSSFAWSVHSPCSSTRLQPHWPCWRVSSSCFRALAHAHAVLLEHPSTSPRQLQPYLSSQIKCHFLGQVFFGQGFLFCFPISVLIALGLSPSQYLSHNYIVLCENIWTNDPACIWSCIEVLRGKANATVPAWENNVGLQCTVLFLEGVEWWT